MKKSEIKLQTFKKSDKKLQTSIKKTQTFRKKQLHKVTI